MRKIESVIIKLLINIIAIRLKTKRMKIIKVRLVRYPITIIIIIATSISRSRMFSSRLGISLRFRRIKFYSRTFRIRRRKIRSKWKWSLIMIVQM